MKKFLSALCLVVVMFLVTGAFADSAVPLYLETNSINCTLSISSAGDATCYAIIAPQRNDRTSSLVMSLKRSSDGKKWSVVKTWSGSSKGAVGTELSMSISVSSGYRYKLYTNGTIYDLEGNSLESASKSSSAISY